MLKKIVTITTMVLLFTFNQATAADNVTIVAPTSEAANGLDLYAVSEIFKDTDNLEDFERAINDPDEGINNLDLDGNGYVDYIRVVEEVVNNTHIVILQAAIGEDEFQDVATIEVEKSGSDYNMHVHGNEVIYGSNYYIAPSHVHVNTWPIIAWIYRPIYRPYHSVFHWGVYPRYWRPFRPLHINVYRGRTLRYTKRNTFVVTRTARVRTVTRVKYKPRTSVRVTKHVGYKKTNVKAGKTTTTKVGVKKTTNTKTGKTTVKKGASKTTTNKYGKKTTVKKGKKTTVNKNGKKTTVKKSKKTKKTKDGKKVTTKKKKKTVKKKN